MRSTTGRGARRGVWWGVVALGIGLIAAPAVFQMFDRAPKGADMIDAFAPYMTTAEIEKFQAYLAEIGEAVDEIDTVALPAAAEAGGDPATEFAAVEALRTEWPGIDADMSDMLATMAEDIDNYEAVAALPPFDLFPWFFVAPGVLLVGIGATVLIRHRRGHRSPVARWLVGAVGIGLILAPVAFQMFERAPKGGVMIDDFRPLMTRPRVQNIQGYFVTMGGGEGQLRNGLVPLALQQGASEDELAAVTRFSDDWQAIVTDFAPMIGTMSDNVTNFEAVDALPDFPLFPWFFVIPGVLLVGLAFAAGPSPRGAPEPEDDNPPPSTRSST